MTKNPTTADVESSFSNVGIPREHGGWSLTLEPVLLGLIIAPSAAGGLLGLAALAAFMARTPVKIALGDRGRGRALPRTLMARRVAGIYLSVGISALGAAIALAVRPFWTPLLAASPLAAVEMWYDARAKGRRLIPELVGPIAVSSVAAAVVLAGGGEVQAAWSAWGLMCARVTASIPFVRAQIRRAKGRPYSGPAVLGWQLGGVALASAFWALGWLPAALVGLVLLLAAVQLVLMRAPVPSTPKLGAQQVIFGMALVIVAALMIRSHYR